MKKLMIAGNLPPALQAELGAMMTAMEKKYGAHATEMGAHIENLATLVTLVGTTNYADADRAQAADAARVICSEVIRALGEALNVNPDSCFAVARALQDFSARANEELLGELPVSSAVAEEAAAVLMKAARTVH